MRGKLARVGVAGVGIAFVLAGCSGNETDGQPTPQNSAKQSAPASSSSAGPSSSKKKADPQDIAWMDGFCGQVIKVTSMSDIKKPQPQKGDIAGAHKAISTYLGEVQARLDSFVQGLKQLPAAPAPEADQAVRNLLEIFVPATDKVKNVKTTLDSAEPTDKQAILDAVKGIKSFGGMIKNVDNPLKPLKGSSVEPALVQAPNCKKLGA